jgi:starch synthase
MSPDEERGEPARRPGAPIVALFPWGDLFHDFLDRLGVTVDELAREFVGSWMFGWAAALRAAGVETLIVCPTTSVTETQRLLHEPTGAQLVLLPTSQLFAGLRRRALVGRRASLRHPGTIPRAVASHTSPYLATPVRAAGRLLRAEGCAAVVCQEYETPRFDVLVGIGSRAGIPVFGTFQGGDYQLSLLERPLRLRTLRACAGLVVGAGEEERRVLERYGLPRAKVHRIPNPVDTDVWSPVGQEPGRAVLGITAAAHVVAWHGQLQVRRKGLDVLLAAWRLLLDRGRLAEPALLLVGMGEDRPLLGELSRDLPGVRIVDDWVEDRRRLRELLCAADVYAFPSRHEGVPVAPLEALACGVPVVGAEASGVRDAVGECGAVVRRDDPVALADALERVLLDPARRALGEAARERAVGSFSLDAVGDRLRATLLAGR